MTTGLAGNVTGTLDEAREALREKQGVGARYDAPDAPARELAWARQGTAYFARVLADLSDEQLYQPSLVPDWTRAHVVAHVGYNARALTRLTEWAATGIEQPMYASPQQRGAEIERGSTLPARALRNLVDHAAVHLDVEWRDLPEGSWDNPVVTAQGRTVAVRETAWMRTREVWIHAVDLDGGGSFLDFPPEVLDALLADVASVWARKGTTVNLELALTDRAEPVVIGDQAAARKVAGRTADVVRWLVGRGARRLSANGLLPDLPAWL